MAGWTNAGKDLVLEDAFRGVATVANYFVALCDSSVAPAYDTATLGDLSEVPDTQGYTEGGYSLTPNTTDFDVCEVADTDDVKLQIKDVVWTASGGTLPASGDGARYAVLLGPNATPSARAVLAYWDLTSNRQVSDGQTLTLEDLEIRINEE